MAKTKEITKISDLVPDANNYNKGNEAGAKLIKKSILQNGFGRSVLADKNGKLIAGNKATEGTIAAGYKDEDIIVVKTDGKKLVVVQRTDIDLDTKKGKEMALADNATASVNLEWDYDTLESDWDVDELEAWGVEEKKPKAKVKGNRYRIVNDYYNFKLMIHRNDVDRLMEKLEYVMLENEFETHADALLHIVDKHKR